MGQLPDGLDVVEEVATLYYFNTVAWQYLAAPFPFPNQFFEPRAGNQEVYLSEQSVNKCDLSLLLMIDSHPQQ